nr:hypothetical protein Iba_chr12eCG7170 [Ipomoea batatas]
MQDVLSAFYWRSHGASAYSRIYISLVKSGVSPFRRRLRYPGPKRITVDDWREGVVPSPLKSSPHLGNSRRMRVCRVIRKPHKWEGNGLAGAKRVTVWTMGPCLAAACCGLN